MLTHTTRHVTPRAVRIALENGALSLRLYFTVTLEATNTCPSFFPSTIKLQTKP